MLSVSPPKVEKWRTLTISTYFQPRPTQLGKSEISARALHRRIYVIKPEMHLNTVRRVFISTISLHQKFIPIDIGKRLLNYLSVTVIICNHPSVSANNSSLFPRARAFLLAKSPPSGNAGERDGFKGRRTRCGRLPSVFSPFLVKIF